MPRRHHDASRTSSPSPPCSTKWASTSSRPAFRSPPMAISRPCREIARRTKRATVAGLARAIEADIARAGAAVRHAKQPRIHTFVSTSPIHLAHQMRKTEDEVLDIITRTVTQARGLVDDVEWSAMDATRTPIDYLCRCVEAAIRAGATTINLPDTVGYALPDEYRAMFRHVRERVPDADKAIFSVHCHNDLGLAVANSLAGLEGGARQIECTINGIGERAGNAALEEVVMAIRTRGDVAALRHRHRLRTWLTRASKQVVGRHRLSGAVQQGDRRPERLRARERHPSGRHAEECLDLRDHDARERRRQQDLAGDGQAFRPPRLQGEAARTGLRARRQRPAGRVQALQGSRRPQEAHLRRGSRRAGRRGDRACATSASSSWR